MECDVCATVPHHTAPASLCGVGYPDLTILLAVKQRVFHHVSQPWVHPVCGARAVTVGGWGRG